MGYFRKAICQPLATLNQTLKHLDTFFTWLGSNRAKKFNVGNKGRLLDVAAQAGLPVPAGGLLLDEFYQLALAEEVAVLQNGRILIPHPDALHQLLYHQVRFPKLENLVAVRSAFSAEDQPDASLAGYFTSQLFVQATDATQLAEALSAVWSSALRREGEFRRDVLVLEMVQAQVAGVAFTEPEFEDDLVNFAAGTADKLVSGHVAGETLTLPKLQSWETADSNIPPFAQRLQKLLRGIRRTFGNQAWDVEWADDGRICWLIQLRPITRAPRRNEALTLANLREILPDPPSPFMTSVVKTTGGQLYQFYHQFDATLPQKRPLVEIYKGRPFFNLSLLADTMRTWGLPTRLVTNSLGGHADQEVGLRFGRFLRHTGTLLKLGLAQLTAVSHAQEQYSVLSTQLAVGSEQFAPWVDAFCNLFALFVTEMLNLTAALSGPLLVLRGSGTLAEHSAGQHTVTTEIFTDLEQLRGRVNSEQWAVNSGELLEDGRFRPLWEGYLAKHGHRGIYESDIARPRYHEDPQPLLDVLQSSHSRPTFHASGPTSQVSRFMFYATRPLWWQCSRVMQAREAWRYHTMRGYDVVRQKLLGLAETAVSRHQLPARDDLWFLTVEEVKALDNGHVYTAEFLAARKQEFADLKVYDFPDLIHRFDDMEQYRKGGTVERKNGRFTGVSLTEGEKNGRAWVLTEPETTLPNGFTPADTILVARSVDPGWIPTFSLVAGVVVEIGGDLSHGSIILREMGLPAITNVRYVTQHIQTGDAVRLVAGSGFVEVSGQN